MKYFVMERQEDGSFKLVEATVEQLKDGSVLYNEEGQQVKYTDPNEQLNSLEQSITDLTNTVKELAAARETDAEERRIAEEARNNGFKMPGVTTENDEKDIDESVLFFDQRVQGKRFYDKMKTLGHEVPEDLQSDINKFFSLSSDSTSVLRTSPTDILSLSFNVNVTDDPPVKSISSKVAPRKYAATRPMMMRVQVVMRAIQRYFKKSKFGVLNRCIIFRFLMMPRRSAMSNITRVQKYAVKRFVTRPRIKVTAKPFTWSVPT